MKLNNSDWAWVRWEFRVGEFVLRAFPILMSSVYTVVSQLTLHLL